MTPKDRPKLTFLPLCPLQLSKPKSLWGETLEYRNEDDVRNPVPCKQLCDKLWSDKVCDFGTILSEISEVDCKSILPLIWISNFNERKTLINLKRSNSNCNNALEEILIELISNTQFLYCMLSCCYLRSLGVLWTSHAGAPACLYAVASFSIFKGFHCGKSLANSGVHQ